MEAAESYFGQYKRDEGFSIMNEIPNDKVVNGGGEDGMGVVVNGPPYIQQRPLHTPGTTHVLFSFYMDGLGLDLIPERSPYQEKMQ